MDAVRAVPSPLIGCSCNMYIASYDKTRKTQNITLAKQDYSVSG